jgi:hypothetical protein
VLTPSRLRMTALGHKHEWTMGARTAASPSTAEGPFEGSQRATTADPMITGFWRRSQDAAATPYSEEGAVDYPMAYHLASTPRRSAQAR